ncbi:MAG: CoB--CoM heterodisulfide reductase iron-sulfur subunit B family protein [Elusimicrobiota bacterium]
MEYIYYPGCSLKGSDKPYEESFLAVFRKLEIPVRELEDWNCCGATLFAGVNEKMALGMAARNFALMGTSPADLIVPCSACYLTLNKAKKRLAEDETIRGEVLKALGEAGYKGELWKGRIRHPLDVLVNDYGLPAIEKRLTRRLRGLRAAPYYGCEIVRPMCLFDDADDPKSMDRLLETLGASVVEWSLKTKCCGAIVAASIEEVGLRLNGTILREAKRKGAGAVVTLCPLCHFNLESMQDKISRELGEDVRLPVLYFTQALGLALGLSDAELGLRRSLSPQLVLR